MKFHVLTVLIFLFTVPLIGSSQTIPEYQMTNKLVMDCKGILTDSKALLGGTTYGHNENFTFKIATGGKITMTFNTPFKIEAGNDTIRFFDGPDTLSPKIGPTYSGTTPPPPIVSNSGYLTVNFKSDNSVAYAGWEAMWNSEHVPPIPPIMSVYPVPNCNSNSIVLLFSKKIACSPISPSDFVISGPQSISVSSISSTQCVSAGDSTTQLTLHLNKAINKNCDYNLNMNLGINDNCDSTWFFSLLDTFRINTCPYGVQIITTVDTICPGTCTQIEAVITGNAGNCLNFTYTWNNGLPPTPGPHIVCPGVTTNYQVTAQIAGGGPTATNSKIITHLTPQITTADSTTICQSGLPFNITKTSSGGYFTGNGITNSQTGLFNPNVAGGGIHTIYYHITQFCKDSINIVVKPIAVGLNQASCPGVTPFLVSGFSPPGGVWSGDSIGPTGIFNPAVPGSYTVTYTVNGCSADKIINVDTIILSTQIDTVCEAENAFQLVITPTGGLWTGMGIIDQVNGIFRPSTAGPGNKVLTYTINGCNFTTSIFVKEIYAGPNALHCPQESSFIISPVGRPSSGYWTGKGIVNSTTGLYNPTMPYNGNNGNDTLYFNALNGCKERKIIYLLNTEITKDSMFFCESDTGLWLDQSKFQFIPCCGVWNGNGVVKTGTKYHFRPKISGIGAHTINYVRNNCSDNIVMVVHPTSINFPDSTVCNTHPSFNLGSMPPGGKWVGQGVNPTTGDFNPSKAKLGVNYIKYISPSNCVDDTVVINVYPYVDANISGIDSILCFSDTNYQLILIPKGGKLQGPGTNDSLGTFNPKSAGEGTHVFSYEFGKGFCKTKVEFEVTILPELTTTVDLSKEEVCLGESSRITINPSGGQPNARYAYSWSDGLFPQQSNPVIPTQTTTYVIITSDGCSDDAIDSVTVKVADEFAIELKGGDQKCLGDLNYAVVKALGNGNYEYLWEGPSSYTTDSIIGKAGEIYTIKIIDVNTGCKKDTLFKIPGYKNIISNFLINPNFDCIPSDRKNVTFIDLSANAVSGTWDFGTGDTLNYVPGSNPAYEYKEAGYYTIQLLVENEGGCKDSTEQTICVLDIKPIFIADAFTPNNDGVNDVLHAQGKGIKEFYFAIYNRLGQIVFETDNIEVGWNGNYKGQPVESGVYIYVIKAQLIDNEYITRKGNVSLLR